MLQAAACLGCCTASAQIPALAVQRVYCEVASITVQALECCSRSSAEQRLWLSLAQNLLLLAVQLEGRIISAVAGFGACE